MTGDASEIMVAAAAVSDRGLSEKRPLNEDSFLSDVERRIFAVADGVGGAEAGEIASQTAVEVLGEAFRHHRNGDDVEDLLELAIQRANASIHQMAQESPHMAMMATTIVALHLEGRRATIGHVGDSRLYRIAADGSIHRETEDHSIVEEEVRAGRMTPEQARHHPSRNVISRALGAESSVEVDLKTIEVESGTTFLLCSDGITRHIMDEELSEVVGRAASLDAACEELKRRCYERGAEDNLTAVLIRLGEANEDFFSTLSIADEQTTLISERKAHPVTVSPPAPVHTASGVGGTLSRPLDDAGRNEPDSSHAHAEPTPVSTVAGGQDSPTAQPALAKRSGGAGRALALLFLFAAAAAAAFYGGMRYQQGRAASNSDVAAVAMPSPIAPTPLPTAAEEIEGRKLAVDRSPATEAERMGALLREQPNNAEDPVFLYLYGRSLMRTGDDRAAAAQFESASKKIQDRFTSDKASLLIDAYLATIAAHVGSNDLERARQASQDFKLMLGSGAPEVETVAPTPAASPSPF